MARVQTELSSADLADAARVTTELCKANRADVARVQTPRLLGTMPPAWRSSRPSASPTRGRAARRHGSQASSSPLPGRFSRPRGARSCAGAAPKAAAAPGRQLRSRRGDLDRALSPALGVASIASLSEHAPANAGVAGGAAPFATVASRVPSASHKPPACEACLLLSPRAGCESHTSACGGGAAPSAAAASPSSLEVCHLLRRPRDLDRALDVAAVVASLSRAGRMSHSSACGAASWAAAGRAARTRPRDGGEARTACCGEPGGRRSP